MDDIKDKLIPNLKFRDDEEEIIEEIGINKPPIIPSLRQRNSQIHMLENLEQKKRKTLGFDFENKPKSITNKHDGVPRRRRFEAQKQAVLSTSVDDSQFNESYMVIEFNNDADTETLKFIIDKIRGSKKNGGAELLIKKEPLLNDSQQLVLHVSATQMKFLELADEMDLSKPTKTGIIRNFNVACLDDFFHNENMTVDDILTPGDRQMIIKYALENIRANDDEYFLPGAANISLYHGESIIQAAITGEIITNFYTLHDKDYLKRLRHVWCRTIRKQPIDLIRNYFGESIAMYFSFLGFYTLSLAVPTILGFLQLGLSEETETIPFFCVFYVIWMKVFLEMWKRKSSGLAYRWGTITMTNLDTPRIGFYGKLGRDPITGKLTPQYPKWKTYVQMYFVTLPIILICVTAAGTVAIAQFSVESYLIDAFGPDHYINYVPSIVNAIYIAVLTIIYDRFATYLTDKENHRTQSQYERHRVNKLIVLEFVNNFLCLFYIAFYLQDFQMLKKQLMMQLIVLQFIQNFLETFVPYLKKKLAQISGRLFLKPHAMEKLKETHEVFDKLNVLSLEEDDIRIQRNMKEQILDEYNTYDDYLELYIQFGYVVLFSSVAPLAAFWAFLNNIFEIRLDAYKLCRFYRRPFARRTKNVGAWQLAFEMLAISSIFTNCGILYLSPQIRDLGANMTEKTFTLVFLVIEHILLGLMWFIYKAIPDTPLWVRVALAKADYESRQALKRED